MYRTAEHIALYVCTEPVFVQNSPLFMAAELLHAEVLLVAAVMTEGISLLLLFLIFIF